ncbi:E3 ubiquitin-protein ligase HERC2 [Porphyridium purpureum]|uniref:E3 ubiquitin-protein ligase HERC2 n=1 Tax=Porphyridium purpureum TaxID=35688 RepID=A0A5J4Z6C3_PORPP|nr:E3 ubiquitin-protein ligase HERC2 [Porphyridium purpureum]|eukprot:POR9206..scf295_1
MAATVAAASVGGGSAAAGGGGVMADWDVKIEYGGEIRRAQLSTGEREDLKLEQLDGQLRSMYGADVGVATQKVFYKDDEGDLVRLTHEDELRVACALARECAPQGKRPCLRLVLTPLHAAAPAAGQKRAAADSVPAATAPAAASGMASPASYQVVGDMFDMASQFMGALPPELGALAGAFMGGGPQQEPQRLPFGPPRGPPPSFQWGRGRGGCGRGGGMRNKMRRLASETSPETVAAVIAAGMALWTAGELPKLMGMVPQLASPVRLLAQEMGKEGDDQNQNPDPHRYDEIFVDPVVAKMFEAGISEASVEKVQVAMRAVLGEKVLRSVMPWIAKKLTRMVEPDMSRLHPQVVCDRCDMAPLIGPRFRCMKCDDFDLCESCFDTFSEEQHVDGSHRKAEDFLRIERPWDPRTRDEPPRLVPDAPLNEGDMGPSVVHLKSVLVDLGLFSSEALKKWHAMRFGPALREVLLALKREHGIESESGATYDAVTRATLLSMVEAKREEASSSSRGAASSTSSAAGQGTTPTPAPTAAASSSSLPVDSQTGDNTVSMETTAAPIYLPDAPLYAFEKSDKVVALKKAMTALGLFPLANSGPLFGTALQNAVMKLKKDNGLENASDPTYDDAVRAVLERLANRREVSM